jgi:lipoprotein NlpD
MTQRAAPVQDRRAAVAPPPQPVVVEPVLAPGPVATYTVKRGDTLHSIALELGIDYRDLARWNGLDATARLRVGQPLRTVPTEEEAAVQIGTARGTGPLDARPLDSRPLDTPAAPPVRGDAAAMKTSPKALRLPYSEQNLALLAKGEPQVAVAKPAPVPVAIEPRPEPCEARGARPRCARLHVAGEGPGVSGFFQSPPARASTSAADRRSGGCRRAGTRDVYRHRESAATAS